MGHKEDANTPTFGPGHDGWYEIRRLNGSVPKPGEMPRYKAKSAFSAAAQAGLSLTEVVCTPITCPECIYELEYGEPVSSTIRHQCEE